MSATSPSARRPAPPRLRSSPCSRRSLLVARRLQLQRRERRRPSASVAAVATASADRRPRPRPPSPTPAPAFPVTLTDDEGTAVTLAAEPQKIVSLTPAVTETLFAVGAGDRVVADRRLERLPGRGEADLPDVVTFGTVDVEKIVSLGPDLVIAGGAGFTSADAIAQLRDARDPGPRRVDAVDRRHLQGHRARRHGGRRVRRGRRDDRPTMRADMQAIADGRPGRSQRRRRSRASSTTSATSTRPARSTARARARSSPRWSGSLGVDVDHRRQVTYEIPLETLIERDPQVIILGVNAFYTPTPETVAKRTGWKVLTAVKTGDIRSGDDTEITRPGPRLADRHAQPGAGDVPRPPAPAGRTERHAVTARTIPGASGGAGLAGRIRGRPALIAAVGLVAARRPAGRRRDGRLDRRSARPTRSGSSSIASSGSTSAAPGPPPPRRSSGTCGCRGS